MHSSVLPTAPALPGHPAAAIAPDSSTQPTALRSHTNPLASCQHLRARSHYLAPSSGDLRYPGWPDRPVTARDRTICQQLQSHVGAAGYPCVMARSVFNRETFRLAVYGGLGRASNAELLCHDLYEFCAEFAAPVGPGVSFLACFDGEAPADELAFEALMWAQLRDLHAIDKRFFPWDAAVGANPESPNFSFSAGGRGFFLIGMHAWASRLSRRTPMPVIVFNLHAQFAELRSSGKFNGIRDTVQSRDVHWQGSINPMAADFGARSEAAQYSGRAVAGDWSCPFKAGRA